MSHKKSNPSPAELLNEKELPMFARFLAAPELEVQGGGTKPATNEACDGPMFTKKYPSDCDEQTWPLMNNDGASP